MSDTSYDLRSEPWIPVRRLNGSQDVVSLRQALADAHVLTAVTGELPTIGVALLRLLLAVLHRSLPASDPSLGAMEQWGNLWRADVLPLDDVEEYLEHVGDRMDLLSPLHPFLQVADLHTAKNEMSPLIKLVADFPDGHAFFTNRSPRDLAAMSFAEAARWLVHCQAYDPSGIKSGAVGDPRVKGGKGYPIGTGWAGRVGVVIVEGGTLRETLLLNLPLHNREGAPWGDDDPAVWELPPLGPAEEVSGGRPPRGPVDLLTWPSRRLRLSHNGERVTGVLVCNGDRLPSHTGSIEPMTAWRRSPTQEKAVKSPTPVYMPLAHRADRSLWRGLAALLPQEAAPSPADGASRLPPLTLVWLRRLADMGLGPQPDQPLRTRAVGLTYGSNDSVVSELVDDAVVVHAVLLGESGAALRGAALEAVASAEASALAVANLAGNLVQAACGSTDPVEPYRERAREDYYFSLDADFRTWLAGLVPASDPAVALRHWQRVAWRRAREQERHLLEESGPTAWVGRTTTDPRGSRHVDAALASLWFRHALARALPLGAPAQGLEPPVLAPTSSSIEEVPA